MQDGFNHSAQILKRMLMCLNQHRAAVVEWAVLRLRIATTSMPEYVFGWCRHGF